jgi:hypothetical protein
LGIWVAFLKQPDALPGRAPKKMKYIYFWTTLNHLWFFINDFYFLEFFKNFFFVSGALPGMAVRAVSKKRPKSPMLDIPFYDINLYGKNNIFTLKLFSQAVW